MERESGAAAESVSGPHEPKRKSRKERRIERRVARLRRQNKLAPDRPTEAKSRDTYEGIRSYRYRPDEQRVLLRSEWLDERWRASRRWRWEGGGRPGPTADERAVLLAVYDQVGASWRMLTDVRFKLMALLPPVAAVALIAVVAEAGPFVGLHQEVRLGLAAFGLLATVGLYIYDRRNNELYDDLISRGRRLEFELGVHSGVFLGRPGSQRRGRTHGTATGIVYWVVMGAWVAAGVYAAVWL